MDIKQIDTELLRFNITWNTNFSFGKRSSTTQTDGSARWRARRDRSAPAASEHRKSNGVCENESIDFHRAREILTKLTKINLDKSVHKPIQNAL